jgi:uncharacterized SAM-binding protein YcdF (DUF218 family)
VPDVPELSEAGGAPVARIRQFALTGRPAVGLVAGAQFGLLLLELGVWNLKGDNLALQGVLACAILGAVGSVWGRFVRYLLAVDIGLLCLMWLVAFTPVMTSLSSRNIRADSLPSAGVDAVVVLGANVTTGRTLSDIGADRLLTGIELVRRGVAPRLLTTRVTYQGSGMVFTTDADQQRLVELAGVRDRWILVPDVVRNTHDEALAMDRRLRGVGARRIALVTSPWHTRRACATFEQVGFRVYCVPALERGAQTRKPLIARDRLAAFRYYLYEQIGWLEYRRRGWVRAR